MTLAVNLKNVLYNYSSYRENNISYPDITLAKGESLFITGKSGSGKSTLLNILSGISIPQSGNVEILDKDISILSQKERDLFRGNNIGYIFQRFNLIPYLTVRENILLPIKISKQKLLKIENMIDEFLESISTDLNIKDILNKRVNQLSVGQQQRVAAARALIGFPDIIIADEPTSSLDFEMTKKFMEMLMVQQRKNKFSLVFVSHDQRLSSYFDKTLHLGI